VNFVYGFMEKLRKNDREIIATLISYHNTYMHHYFNAIKQHLNFTTIKEHAIIAIPIRVSRFL